MNAVKLFITRLVRNLIAFAASHISSTTTYMLVGYILTDRSRHSKMAWYEWMFHDIFLQISVLVVFVALVFNIIIAVWPSFFSGSIRQAALGFLLALIGSGILWFPGESEPVKIVLVPLMLVPGGFFFGLYHGMLTSLERKIKHKSHINI